MHVRKVLLAPLVAALLCTAGLSLAADTAPAAATAKMAQTAAQKDAVSQAQNEKVVDPLTGRDTSLLKKFYLLNGGTYDKTTGLINNLNPALTGLDAKQDPYYLRVNKDLTDKYFRQVRAYSTKTHELLGDYYVAKDQSSVWRLDGKDPGMIYGSAENLVKKSKLIVYPRYLVLGSQGLVRMDIPGNVPYEIDAKSLNENIARVKDNGVIEPLTTGKANILVDYVIGDQKGSAVQEISVITQQDMERLRANVYMNEVYWNTIWRYDPWPYGWGFRPYYHHPAPPPPPRHHPMGPPPPRR